LKQQAPLWHKQILRHFHIPDPLYVQHCSENDDSIMLVLDRGIQDVKEAFGVSHEVCPLNFNIQ
jgi:hypothetical protein